MNEILIPKENSSDLSDIVLLLLKHDYSVSVEQDESFFIIHFDFRDIHLSKYRIAWITEEEFEEVLYYRSKDLED